jgi:hypothetical protein
MVEGGSGSRGKRTRSSEFDVELDDVAKSAIN